MDMKDGACNPKAGGAAKRQATESCENVCTPEFGDECRGRKGVCNPEPGDISIKRGPVYMAEGVCNPKSGDWGRRTVA
eukprot:14928201-Alexandrium_andersonii.AAC.1